MKFILIFSAIILMISIVSCDLLTGILLGAHIANSGDKYESKSHSIPVHYKESKKKRPTTESPIMTTTISSSTSEMPNKPIPVIPIKFYFNKVQTSSTSTTTEEPTTEEVTTEEVETPYMDYYENQWLPHSDHEIEDDNYSGGEYPYHLPEMSQRNEIYEYYGHHY